MVALEELDIAGTAIPQGAIVAGMLQSANRDPRRFDDPESLDVTRTVNPHLGFGWGLHRCIGAPLASMEGRLAISGLFRRYPKMRLGVPAEQLQWLPTPFFRQLRELPVKLGG
jgi:cytochrome P450